MFEIKITLSNENKSRVLDSNSQEIIKFHLKNSENEIKYDKIEISTALEKANELKWFETFTGHIQIMRVKSENISLTDKYEFFRFLPIKRNNIILILAIPDRFNEEDFMKFIDSFITQVKYIRFIHDVIPSIEKTANSSNHEYSFLRCLIYFDKQDTADNFYYEFNTKSFPGNKFEYLYCVYIDRIYYEFTEISKCNQNILMPLLFDPNKEQSELFCCPMCLEKLDTSSTGIHTLVSMGSHDRWDNFKKICNVCKKFSQKFSACLKCNSKENIWCCMICGFTGCDRYQKGHAVEHFNNTLHRYSIDLVSQRIWDYLGDGWVHRVIKLKQGDGGNNLNNLLPNRDTIFLENEISNSSTSSTKEFLIRMENIISEYNCVLASQLEDQRKYYEKELNRHNESNDQRLKIKSATLNALREELAKKKIILENNKKFMKECSKKLNNQHKKLEDVQENIELNHSLIENLRRDIDLLKINKERNLNDDNLCTKEKKILESRIKRKEELQIQLDNMYNLLSEK